MDRYEGVERLGVLGANVFTNLTLSFWTKSPSTVHKTNENVKSLHTNNEQIKRIERPAPPTNLPSARSAPLSAGRTASLPSSTSPFSARHLSNSSVAVSENASTILAPKTAVHYRMNSTNSILPNNATIPLSSSSSNAHLQPHESSFGTLGPDNPVNISTILNKTVASSKSVSEPLRDNRIQSSSTGLFTSLLESNALNYDHNNHRTSGGHSITNHGNSSLWNGAFPKSVPISASEMFNAQLNANTTNATSSGHLINIGSLSSSSLLTSHYGDSRLQVPVPNTSTWNSLNLLTNTIASLADNGTNIVEHSSYAADLNHSGLCDGYSAAACRNLSSIISTTTTMSSYLTSSDVSTFSTGLDSFGVSNPQDERVYWGLFLIILPILALFGNMLVILSVYRERSLQTVTNWFIVSLGLADLLVTIPMFFSLYHMVNVDWGLSDVVCDLYIACDVICSTASIFNLVAISFDRFIAVTHPIFYSKHKNDKRVILTILLVWIASIGVGLPIMLGANTSPERIPELCIFYNSDFIIYSSLWSFYVPCLIMVILYYKIFKAIHDRAKKKLESSKNKQHLMSGSTTGPGNVTGHCASGQLIAPVSGTTVGQPNATGSMIGGQNNRNSAVVNNNTNNLAVGVGAAGVGGVGSGNLIKSIDGTLVSAVAAVGPKVTVMDKPVRVLGPNAIAAVQASAAAAAAAVAAAAAGHGPTGKKTANCSVALISNLTISGSIADGNVSKVKDTNFDNQLDHNENRNNNNNINNNNNNNNHKTNINHHHRRKPPQDEEDDEEDEDYDDEDDDEDDDDEEEEENDDYYGDAKELDYGRAVRSPSTNECKPRASPVGLLGRIGSMRKSTSDPQNNSNNSFNNNNNGVNKNNNKNTAKIKQKNCTNSVGVPQIMFTVEQASNQLKSINQTVPTNQASKTQINQSGNEAKPKDRNQVQNQRRSSTSETPTSSCSSSSPSSSTSSSGAERRHLQSQKHQHCQVKQKFSADGEQHFVKDDSFPISDSVEPDQSGNGKIHRNSNRNFYHTQQQEQQQSNHNHAHPASGQGAKNCLTQSDKQPETAGIVASNETVNNNKNKTIISMNETLNRNNNKNIPNNDTNTTTLTKSTAGSLTLGQEKSSSGGGVSGCCGGGGGSGADGGAKNGDSSADSPTVPMGASSTALALTNNNKSNGSAEVNGANNNGENGTGSKKKSRFNLGRKHKSSRKKKEKASAKRERKATKTLAIVLGVFLFCWIPFFSCNILDAICIKLHENHFIQSECRPGMTAFLLTTWLGYMNSCANPLIYTIFNPDESQTRRNNQTILKATESRSMSNNSSAPANVTVEATETTMPPTTVITTIITTIVTDTTELINSTTLEPNSTTIDSNSTTIDANSTTDANSSILFSNFTTLNTITAKKVHQPGLLVILSFLGIFVILMSILMCVLCTNMKNQRKIENSRPKSKSNKAKEASQPKEYPENVVKSGAPDKSGKQPDKSDHNRQQPSQPPPQPPASNKEKTPGFETCKEKTVKTKSNKILKDDKINGEAMGKSQVKSTVPEKSAAQDNQKSHHSGVDGQQNADGAEHNSQHNSQQKSTHAQ